MPYTKTEAKKLLTAPELELFDTSRPPLLRKLTKPELRKALERSRRLRDKYHDLFRRQRLAIRAESGSKSGASGNANERTRQKEDIFAETVARFEERIVQIEQQEDDAHAKASAS